jgi:hypothetical protein
MILRMNRRKKNNDGYLLLPMGFATRANHKKSWILGGFLFYYLFSAELFLFRKKKN